VRTLWARTSAHSAFRLRCDRVDCVDQAYARRAHRRVALSSLDQSLAHLLAEGTIHPSSVAASDQHCARTGSSIIINSAQVWIGFFSCFADDPSQVQPSTHAIVPCTLVDISQTGARLLAPGTDQIPGEFTFCSAARFASVASCGETSRTWGYNSCHPNNRSPDLVGNSLAYLPPPGVDIVLSLEIAPGRPAHLILDVPAQGLPCSRVSALGIDQCRLGTGPQLRLDLDDLRPYALPSPSHAEPTEKRQHAFERNRTQVFVFVNGLNMSPVRLTAPFTCAWIVWPPSCASPSGR
jgi:hypothetical protein